MPQRNAAQTVWSSLAAGGGLLFLHWIAINSRGQMTLFEQIIYFGLLAFGLFCVALFGSKPYVAVNFLFLTGAVIGAEVLTPSQELVLVRCMGAFVGACFALWMLRGRGERKWWEFPAIFFLSFGCGMVMYQAVIDWREWDATIPAYQALSAFLPAALGLLVFPRIVRAVQNRIDQIGGTTNANPD